MESNTCLIQQNIYIFTFSLPPAQQRANKQTHLCSNTSELFNHSFIHKGKNKKTQQTDCRFSALMNEKTSKLINLPHLVCKERSVCACVRMFMFVCVCVCVCVYEFS